MHLDAFTYFFTFLLQYHEKYTTFNPKIKLPESNYFSVFFFFESFTFSDYVMGLFFLKVFTITHGRCLCVLVLSSNYVSVCVYLCVCSMLSFCNWKFLYCMVNGVWNCFWFKDCFIMSFFICHESLYGNSNALSHITDEKYFMNMYAFLCDYVELSF